METMNERIVEPIPVGLAGRLVVDEEGATFKRGPLRYRFGEETPLGEGPLGVRSGDVLLGWLQCYRGWTAQPAPVVERWLGAGPSGEKETGKGQDVRVVFRLADFERFQSQEGRSLSYGERKALLDRFAADGEHVQKNLYLVLNEPQVRSFLSAQPTLSQWLVRPGEERALLEASESGSLFTRKEEGREEHRQAHALAEAPSGVALDVAAAGGWVDLSAIEDRVQRMSHDLEEQSEHLNQAKGEIERLKQLRREEQLLRQAGGKYLDQLKGKGERCIRAMSVQEDAASRLEAFNRLFESSEVALETLERRTEALALELEQCYPTRPIARSTGLDLPKPSRQTDWNQFRIAER